MTPSLPPLVRRPTSVLAGLAACLAGCDPHPTGIIVVPDTGPPGLPVLYEVEPNDEAWYANEVGPVVAGEHFLIEGHITECCPDPFDGFAFVAVEPMEVELTLHAHDPTADLDFCIYDPVADVMLACFEGMTNPEIGSVGLALPAEFHVVVSSWYGDSPYTLEVRTYPMILGLGHEGAPAGFAAVEGAFRSLPAPVDGEVRERFAAYREPRLVELNEEAILHLPVFLRPHILFSAPTRR
ncbi:MAG: hypothetical protein QF903_01430 [Planctomycetota bacterium]|jgi:hypothetical protein|nr:hypothetical protein [Planctomycetota bacterium]MDP6764366.1 hypothetical protein [Planctomycetota bacterium]MDP6988124.1 hypothetical protein [Planctomycetota bacterium]